MLLRSTLLAVGGVSLSTALATAAVGPMGGASLHILKVEAAGAGAGEMGKAAAASGGMGDKDKSTGKAAAGESAGSNERAGSKESKLAAPPARKLIKASELAIYEDPSVEDRYEFIEDKQSAYYQAVSQARKAVCSYTDSMKGTTKQVTDVYKQAKKTVQDGLQYIQKDSGAVPRAVFISVAGLGGIVAGYRGGFIRKTTYATIAMGGAAALCYPKQAYDLSHKGWVAVRDGGLKVYKDISEKQPEQAKPAAAHKQHTAAPATTAAAGTTAAATTAAAAVKPAAKEADKKQREKKTENSSEPTPERVGQSFFRSGPPPNREGGPPNRAGGPPSKEEPAPTATKDYGMSNPQDKDMYSTRSSK